MTETYSIAHRCHMISMIATILLLTVFLVYCNYLVYPETTVCYIWQQHGWIYFMYILLCRFSAFLSAPQAILCILGLFWYDTFPKRPVFKLNPNFKDKICISVVTRGDYPDLVNQTLEKNIKTCLKTPGAKSFIFQLLTEQPLRLSADIAKQVKVLVIPENYCTKSGVIFKARNMQYGLEQNLNVLKDNDWIGEEVYSLVKSNIKLSANLPNIRRIIIILVHLDEETLMTEDSANGILKFCQSGDRDFGHGLLTLGNNKTLNWLVFAADAVQPSESLGHIR